MRSVPEEAKIQRGCETSRPGDSGSDPEPGAVDAAICRIAAQTAIDRPAGILSIMSVHGPLGATPQNLSELSGNLNALLSKVVGVLNASNRFGVPAMASTFFNIGSVTFGVVLGVWLGPALHLSRIEGMPIKSAKNCPATTMMRGPR